MAGASARSTWNSRVSALNPLLRAFGLQRIAQPRGRRIFHAALSNRLNAGLFSGTTSGHQDARVDVRKLRNRSRTAFRDSAVAKRYGQLFAENVVGARGILLQPRALGRNGELDVELNARHQAAWELWCDEHCSVDGRLDWVDLLQTRRRLEPMDGETIVRIIDGASNPFGFALQLIDADQLDLDYNQEPIEGRVPMIRQGVEMDQFGRPVAYHIWPGHPNDNGRGRRERVPAEDILHEFMLWRPGAARGIPWMHAALSNLSMLDGYLEAELVAAREGASKMGWIAGGEDEEEQLNVPMETQPGTFGKLPDGYTVQQYDPQHPNAVMPEFVKANIRLFAIAGGVSYTSLSGDLEAVNFSSIRAGQLAERDFYRMLQQREIRRFCRRVHRRWLRMANLTGQFRYAATDLPRLLTNRWLPRGFPWADPLAEIQTIEREIKLGVNSRTRIAAEHGNDIRELFEELDAEQQLADEYEVPIQGTDRPPVMPNDSTSATERPNGTDRTKRRALQLAIERELERINRIPLDV
jgi:lambda family phage portal protein